MNSLPISAGFRQSRERSGAGGAVRFADDQSTFFNVK